MTKEEMTEIINTQNIRGNLVGLLYRQFPKDTDSIEDWAQRALIRAFKNCEVFYDAAGITGYAREAAIGLALNDKEKAIERRKTLRDQPRYKKTKDPMRHIDYKVDLERAIHRTVREQSLQAALWEIHFERATWQDVLNDMPKTKNYSAWEKALQRSNAELRQEMRRKGYRRS